MSAKFEELDHGDTPMGEIVLRRRTVLSLGGLDVYEVKLDGQFLMSSIVNEAEIALARDTLPMLGGVDEIDVLVGGLGLGYTAAAALDGDQVRSVTVVEYVERVIGWHQKGLVPLAEQLTTDTRCQLVHGDFFAMVGDLTSELGGARYHAILVDIDHSPEALLRPTHAAFYTSAGLQSLESRLHPGGLFALWSADPPESSLLERLRCVLEQVDVMDCAFHNPLLDEDDHNFIVVGRRRHDT